MPQSWRSGRRDLPAKDPGGPAAKFFPPHIYALFQPNPPLEYKPAITKRKMPPLSGLAKYTAAFEEGPAPERQTMKTPKQVQAEKREAKAVEHAKKREEKASEWDPQTLGEHATTDPFRTLFVARISLDVTERKLVKEYSRFGTITKCVMIMDKEGEPRGYAFLEFEKEADMREAYKKGDGLKIHGRRVLVDVERGRTVRGWKPRRLGGGLGGTRKGGKTENVTHSGRMDAYRGGGSRSYSDRGRRDYDRSRRSDRGRDRDRERRDRDRSDRKRDRDRGERGEDRKRARD